MITDKWITVEQAMKKIRSRKDVSSTTKVKRRDAVFLVGLNIHGCKVVQQRIYNGTEHPSAKAGMCVDRC